MVVPGASSVEEPPVEVAEGPFCLEEPNSCPVLMPMAAVVVVVAAAAAAVTVSSYHGSIVERRDSAESLKWVELGPRLSGQARVKEKRARPHRSP